MSKPSQQSDHRPATYEPEAQKRTILEMSFDAFIEIDSEGLIAGWNSRSETMFGWSRREALGKKFVQRLIASSCREALQKELGIYFGREGRDVPHCRVESVALHREGKEFPLEIKGAQVAGGGIRRLALFARDLSWQKEMEEALFASRQRYRAILDQLGDGYIETEIGGKYRFVNEAFWRLFDVPEEERTPDSPKQSKCPEELIGKDFREYQTEEQIREAVPLYYKVMETGQPTSVERNLSRGRRTIFVTSYISLIKNRHGKVTGWRTLFRDCTERKLREQAIAQAMEKAEAASRAKSEFLANMSHEIRTPMNGILGMTELTLSTSLTSEQHEYVSTVRSCAMTLLGTINDILDYSKLKAGKMVLDPVRFHLPDVMDEVVKRMDPLAREKHLRFSLQVDPDAPNEVIGDSARLRQVLLELAGNAVKYTQQGEVMVQVSVQERGHQALTLHFAVRDTGIGIAPEQLEKILKGLEMGEAARTRYYGGAALGLAITSRLVQMMGGRIWVESIPGSGSTFHFTATLRQAGAEDPLAVADGGSADGARIEGRQLRVLVAEDNTVNQKLAQALLRKMGHEVVIAGNGALALQALEDAHFDVVLMDVEMPEMDGLQAAMAIREKERAIGGHIPILALSAQGSEDKERFVRAGMDDYVSKPIDAGRLRTILERYGRSRA